MALLNPDVQKQVKEHLGGLPNPVTLHVFTQELECQYCRENRVLAEELAHVVPNKIKVAVHNFVTDKEPVGKYAIDKIPAIAVVGEKDYGVRFYGIPAGYEFTSLLSAIKIVSAGTSELSPSSRDKLGAITKPLQIKVFVTPTCPYCPSAVHMAHRLAVATPLIQADMIEVTQFPHLAVREQVMGVPKVVVPGVGSFEGALPEPQFVSKIVEMVTGGSA
ncbi:thioredoxin family protein [candidate division FCPU426 bacterium]|nr:thioredoxin family protein [candidate division FCPU426 bacterium]